MSLESDVQRMAESAPFRLLPREGLRLIAFYSETRRLKAGDALFKAGDGADAAFLVLDGEILLAANGAERRAGPGAVIGEMALLADLKRRASAQASVETTLLKIPRAAFRRVLREFPEAADKLRSRLAKRTQALLQSLEELRVRRFAP